MEQKKKKGKKGTKTKATKKHSITTQTSGSRHNQHPNIYHTIFQTSTDNAHNSAPPTKTTPTIHQTNTTTPNNTNRLHHSTTRWP